MLHTFVAYDEREDTRREQEETKKIAELRDRFLSLLNNLPGMTFTKDAETGVYLADHVMQLFRDAWLMR